MRYFLSVFKYFIFSKGRRIQVILERGPLDGFTFPCRESALYQWDWYGQWAKMFGGLRRFKVKGIWFYYEIKTCGTQSRWVCVPDRFVHSQGRWAAAAILGSGGKWIYRSH